jgi:hypothetical protein
MAWRRKYSSAPAQRHDLKGVITYFVGAENVSLSRRQRYFSAKAFSMT